MSSDPFKINPVTSVGGRQARPDWNVDIPEVSSAMDRALRQDVVQRAFGRIVALESARSECNPEL